MTPLSEPPGIRTHEAIDRSLCGEPLELGDGMARVGLTLRAEMSADASGLVHGGFVFGLADFAAMLAINHPNVVLGSAEVRFLAPLTVGDHVEAEARVHERRGSKQVVHVTVERARQCVFDGEFVCFVLERHVLAARREADE